jgi:holo-[acyl-carrier protein] synthase
VVNLILGIGTDIVEIERIRAAVERNEKFLSRIFSKNEIEYLARRNFRSEFVAGRFAAKEAVVKAMGTGFSGFDCRDVEIDRNAAGKPIVILKGKAKQLVQKYGNYKIHVSISHEIKYAIAYAILEVNENANWNDTDNEEH